MPIRLLVDTLVDRDLTNAQLTSAREIIARLDPDRFHVTTFHGESPDARVAARPATRLIRLPARRRTVRLFTEFVGGRHDILFYVKAAPAAELYFRLRRLWRPRAVTIGTLESQADWRSQPTIAPTYVRRWERTVLRCDHLVSISRCAARSLRSEYRLDSHVIPVGVDTEHFRPGPRPSTRGRPRVLFVGTLISYKRPHLLLEAAERFPEADFVVVGTGPLEGSLSACVRERRLANVVLTGAIDAERLRQAYREADVFLFPSQWEGSPKVILEAAASGLPVIACRDYEPETVLHERTGYVVRSPDELLARLGRLLRSPDLRIAFGAAGRRLAERYDWSVVVRRWEALFVRVLGRRSRADVKAGT